MGEAGKEILQVASFSGRWILGNLKTYENGGSGNGFLQNYLCLSMPTKLPMPTKLFMPWKIFMYPQGYVYLSLTAAPTTEF